MPTQPAVSILMPVFNAADTLPATLRSLRRQQLRDWQLVAVDDGSSDSSLAILTRATGQDPRIDVLCQPHAGISAALNHGLAQCRSCLIARMDADDLSHPQRLARQWRYMRQHPETTVVGCGVRAFPKQMVKPGMARYLRWQNKLHEHEAIVRNMFVESPLVHPSVMFRKLAVTTLGGYRNRPWCEDYDLWLRLAQNQARFARLPKILYFWRESPQRLTRTAAYCSKDAFRACKAHFLAQSPLATFNTITIWGAGPEGKRWARLLLEQGWQICRWLELDPRKIGQRLYGARVEHVEAYEPDGSAVVVAVAAPGARRQIRTFLHQQGLTEGYQFWCVT